MASIAKAETSISSQPSAFNWRAALPIYVFFIGAMIAGITLGGDLLGLHDLLNEGALQANFLRVGLAILFLGAVMDLTFGKKYLLAWLKAQVVDWQGLLKFIAIAAQLSLLVAVMRLCYLEHNAFYNNVMPLTLYGFVIHYFLPPSYRLTFFILLSIGAILGVFGLADGAWLIGISLALIGICHLPIRFWFRVTILLLAVAALIAMRLGYLPAPWTKAIWPVVASMFMFRMIIYLYDLKHKKTPGGIAQTLSYFFLLPNVAFPLFPVVDYSTFGRTYYNEEQYRIYQKGLHWIFWGVVHLLIYRYVNYYWVIDAGKVKDTFTLAQYMISNYALIIRLTGQFHLIVGILHLFGFNLPRVMDVLFLADGFTDYWRRVNVYWKEFIQKVFYYPAYFGMRQFGNMTKLVLATCIGFLVTWFLHAYQWFWIRGSYVFTLPDVLFWTSLAGLVLANSIYEAKHGRKRVLVKRAATVGEIAVRTLRASGIFVAMMVLWSMWISPSLAEWVDLIFDSEVTWLGVLATLAVIVAVLGAAMVVYEKWPVLAVDASAKQSSFYRFAAAPVAAIVALYFLVQPEFSLRLGPTASHLIADLRTNRLNERDEALLQKGYYENLTNTNTFNSQLDELYAQRPDDWITLTRTKAVRRTDDFLRYELVPSLDGSLKDAPMATNRWGMRDDEYEQTPPPNTCRIALLGASVEMGSGVLHEETFEYLLEKRLNREHAGGKYARYEILNYSVGGYHLLQQLITLEKKVWDFKPNVIFYIVHGTENGGQFFKSPLTPEKIDINEIPFEGLREILHRAGVNKMMRTEKITQRLEPFSDEVLLWSYSRIVADCRQRNVLPIWICLPTWPGISDSAKAIPLVRIAEQAGFHPLNLADVYDSQKGAYLQLAPWDKHPNAKGHWLIAEGIYEALRKSENKISLGLAAPPLAKAASPGASALNVPAPKSE